MANDLGPGLASLLTLCGSSHPVLQIASARAVNAIVGSDAKAASLLAYHSSHNKLRKDPVVTSDLWFPGSHGMRLASTSPNRLDILTRLSQEPLGPVAREFATVAGPEFDPGRADFYDRQGAGNEVVKQISSLGDKFSPDTRQLFLIYLALLRRSTKERLEWVGNLNLPWGNIEGLSMPGWVPGAMGALTTSWQLAWAASKQPIELLIEDLEPALSHSSPKRQWAAAQFLEEAVRYQQGGDVDIPLFGGGTGPPSLHVRGIRPVYVQVDPEPPQPVIGERSPAEPTRQPEPRYADITFRRDDGSDVPADTVPNETSLQADRWYWLEVAVRCKPIGIPSDKPEKPLRDIKQKEDVDLVVTARSNDFEIEEEVRRITLPPRGDSEKNAYFHVKPKARQGAPSDRGHIEVRLLFRFNLLEYFLVTAKITPTEQTETKPVLYKHQQSVVRELHDFDVVAPRTMNIHALARDGSYYLEFTLRGNGSEPLVLRGQSTLTNEMLEDKLTRLRDILQDLSVKDFLEKLQTSEETFRAAIRALAKFGRELWQALFPGPAGTPLNVLGKALKDCPVADAGLIQVSLAQTGTKFIYPWAFLYDQDVPEKEYQLPAIEGFWGYRYPIEQQLVKIPYEGDMPEEVEGKLQMAFMLWREFPNAQDQLKLMADLRSESQDEVQISDPPITSKNECYELLRSCDASILYFFAHGHCRKRKLAIELPSFEKFVKRYMALFEKGTDEWRRLEGLAKRLTEEASETDESYIELSNGRLIYRELRDALDELSCRPFVFLNMCESAEIIPFLEENFVSLFLTLKARAVLGTECEMSVNFAHFFSKVFLGEVFRGESLANALRTTRRQFLDAQNPLALAYSLFGSGTLRFLPARIKQNKQ